MIIQLFGMDPEARYKLGQAIAEKEKFWHIVDTDLPMAQLQPQFARWLRNISWTFTKDYGKKNDIGMVTDGYFVSKEARSEYRAVAYNNHHIPDVAVWVDTTDAQEFEDRFGDIQKWEEPDSAEYDIRVTSLDNLDDTVNSILNYWSN